MNALDDRPWMSLTIPKGRKEEKYLIYLDGKDLHTKVSKASPAFRYHKGSNGKDEVRRHMQQKQSDGSFKLKFQLLDRFIAGLSPGDKRQAKTLRKHYTLRGKRVPLNYFSEDLVYIHENRPQSVLIQKSFSLDPCRDEEEYYKQERRNSKVMHIRTLDLLQRFITTTIPLVRRNSDLEISQSTAIISELGSIQAEATDLINTLTEK